MKQTENTAQSWYGEWFFSADLLVGRGRPLSGDLLDRLDGVDEGHGGVEGEEDDGGVAEADDVDGEAGHRGAHKVAQGEGREPDSCKVEKEKSRRWAAAAAAARFSNDWADWRLDGGRRGIIGTPRNTCAGKDGFARDFLLVPYRGCLLD